jgi:hypothetical protein
MIEERYKEKIVCFGKEITGTKVINPIVVLGFKSQRKSQV